MRHRRRTDPAFRMASNIRTRLNDVLRKHISGKQASLPDYVGCSTIEFISHIQSLFQPGMSWLNYGRGHDRWSLDHKQPLSRFNLLDKEELRVAANWRNTQPLWHMENIRKGNKSPEQLAA